MLYYDVSLLFEGRHHKQDARHLKKDTNLGARKKELSGVNEYINKWTLFLAKYKIERSSSSPPSSPSTNLPSLALLEEQCFQDSAR